MTVAACGVQSPRIMHLPAGGDYEFADEALLWLDQVVGFVLDEWEAMVLRESLAEADGRWAATEVGLVVPRQNGKGAILEARELVGLFLLREKLLIHSAHQFKTAQEHFLRISARIADVPELKARVQRIHTGSGEQGVKLKGGERLRFLARKGGSGRGFSAPFVAFDEAMDLPEGTVGDMVPTQSAMPRRQRWYTGSAVDQFEHQNGVTFARVRERGIRAEDTRLAFFEWSLDAEQPDLLERAVMLDDDAIALANPGYGIRIFREAVEDELNSLADRTVAVERFGVGDWPATSARAETVIDVDAWAGLTDRRSKLLDVVCLAADTTPDRAWSSIAAAGLNGEGMPHVEIVEHKRGTGWVAARLAELEMSHGVFSTVCGGKSSTASLEPECKDAGVALKMLSAADEARAFGLMVDVVADDRLRHLGSDELLSAVRGATKRRLGDAWAWDRRDASVDISPLVAASLALWESASFGWDSVDPVIW